jgi:hypothetical protein
MLHTNDSEQRQFALLRAGAEREYAPAGAKPLLVVTPGTVPIPYATLDIKRTPRTAGQPSTLQATKSFVKLK